MGKNLYGPAIAQNVSSPPMTKKKKNEIVTKLRITQRFPAPKLPSLQVNLPPSWANAKIFLNKISTLLVINNFKLTKSKDIE